jgi:hypothetical protein
LRGEFPGFSGFGRKLDGQRRGIPAFLAEFRHDAGLAGLAWFLTV